jgi:hypothetical protein
MLLEALNFLSGQSVGGDVDYRSQGILTSNEWRV